MAAGRPTADRKTADRPATGKPDRKATARAARRGPASARSLAAAGRRGVTAAGDGADHHVDAEHRVDHLLEQVLVLAALEPLHVALAGEAEGEHPFVE